MSERKNRKTKKEEPVKKKKAPKKRPASGGSYFVEEKAINFVSTGCQLLDLTLGGGVAEGRVLNIVGNKSSGKTLLAIEISANFYAKYGDAADINYHESEAAFDKPYAGALGMPIDVINFIGENDENNDNTVEYWYEQLVEKCAELKNTKKPCLYIVDSLDALTDRAELERAIDDKTYGANKAAKMSELFRRLIVEMSEVNITLIVVSQIRDKIGATFGKKTTRSGGKALDFYASQVLWITEIKKLRKTIRGVRRPYGIQVAADCEKNKVGLPYRKCEYEVLLGYGIDDIITGLRWLEQIKELDLVDVTKKDVAKVAKEQIAERDPEFIKKLEDAVAMTWKEIETSFLPKGKKY